MGIGKSASSQPTHAQHTHLRPPLAPSPPPPPCRLKLFCRLSKLDRASLMDADLLSRPAGAPAAPPKLPLPPRTLSSPPPPLAPPLASAHAAWLWLRSRASNKFIRRPPPPPPVLPGVPGREPASLPLPRSMLDAEMRCRAGSCGCSWDGCERLWWYSRI